MSEPTWCALTCPCSCSSSSYCANCDRLVGLDGLHVTGVQVGAGGGLTVTVESPPGPTGCPACGVVAVSKGRRTVTLIDVPCFGRPTRIAWRKRRWACPDVGCQVGTFTDPGAIQSPCSTRCTVSFYALPPANLVRQRPMVASGSGGLTSHKPGRAVNELWTHASDNARPPVPQQAGGRALMQHGGT